MALTPADVAGRLFRLRRRGYDPDEVDGFLDEVESELARLLLENSELRRAAEPDAAGGLPAYTAATRGAPGPDGTPGDPAATPDEAEQIALRTLLAAHRAAELLIGEARVDAAGRVDRARAQCEDLLEAARRHGEQADLAAAERTEATLAELEDIRRSFDARLEELRGYEAEYRRRLRDHLESQLHSLESLDAEPQPSA